MPFYNLIEVMCLLSSNNPLNFDCYSYDEYFTASSIDFSFYQLNQKAAYLLKFSL